MINDKEFKARLREAVLDFLKKQRTRSERSSATVAKVVNASYPELPLHLNQDRQWKETYWQDMLDAVALGMAWREENGK